MEVAHLAPASGLHHGPAVRALVAIAALTGSGCLYTDPIHQRPRAEISKRTEGPVHYPGEVVEFDARKSQGSGATLQYTWQTFRCDGDRCVQVDSALLPGSAIYPVTLDGATDGERHARREIQLTVSDGPRTSRDVYTLEVGNREPVVVLQPRQGDVATDTVVVGAPIDIEVHKADPDGDGLTLSWNLVKPAGSDPAVGLVPGPGDAQRLTPDVAGVWRVEVTARDDFGGQESFAAPIVAQPDQAPCLALTEPDASVSRHLLSRADGPRRFAALLVADDLDPHPAAVDPGPAAGAAGFGWSMVAPSTGGQRVALGERGAGVALDPAAFGAGDRIELRLDVSDRVARTGCPPDAVRCEDRPGCAQRVSWQVEIR
jgi:hypothetical protein